MTNSLFLLATICLIAMISPGPDFVLVTKNSLLHSKRLALATAFGIISGCLFHATYCTLGLAFIITKNIVVFSIVKYAGACYLVYLGIKGLCAKSTKEIQLQNTVTKSTPLRMYLDGLLCNILNPKLAVFLLSLFTQFIAVDASLAAKSMVAGIFVTEAVIYWPLLVIILQSDKIRRLFSNFQTTLNRVCGSLLIYLGIRVAFNA